MSDKRPLAHREAMPRYSELQRNLSSLAVTNVTVFLYEALEGLFVVIEKRRGNQIVAAQTLKYRVVNAQGVHRGRIVKALSLRLYRGATTDNRPRVINHRWAVMNRSALAWADLHRREIMPIAKRPIPGLPGFVSVSCRYFRPFTEAELDPLHGLINHYKQRAPGGGRKKRVTSPLSGLGI